MARFLPTTASTNCHASGINLDHVVSWTVIERAGKVQNLGKTVYVLQLHMSTSKDISLVLGDNGPNDALMRRFSADTLVPIGA